MIRKKLLIELANCLEVKLQKAAAAILGSLESIITTALTAGNSVAVSSTFGAFKPITRSGKAPNTNKPYTNKSVKFSLSAALN